MNGARRQEFFGIAIGLIILAVGAWVLIELLS
jgi:hypothetical protein